MNSPYFLFDIGGSRTRVATSFDGKNLTNVHIFSTPKNYDEALSLLGKTAKEMVGGKIGLAVGGVPGQIDKRGNLYAWNNLKPWSGSSIEPDLRARLDCPVKLTNDTALVGLGEAVYGSGKGKEIVAYVTISTGVNGVRIVNKQIDASARGFEIGRQIIDCRSSKNWEEKVSGMFLAQNHGKPARNISDDNVWKRVSHKVGIGLVNVALFWSPDVIVLGGAVTQSLDLKMIKKVFKNNLSQYETDIGIKKTKLRQEAGLRGALYQALTLA